MLFSDIGVPEVDGDALNRRVQALRDDVARVAAVALTACARRDDRRAAVRAGLDLPLIEPAELHELLVAVATLVEGVRRRRG